MGSKEPTNGFIQKVSGTCLSEKPFKNRGNAKVQFKSDCIDGSIVSGAPEPIFHRLAWKNNRSMECTKNLNMNLLKKNLNLFVPLSRFN